MLGGYQVIDCKGVEISETPAIIKGIFKKAKSGKAILLENCNGMSSFTYDNNVADDEKAILPVILTDNGTEVIVKLEITNEDTIKIVVPE